MHSNYALCRAFTVNPGRPYWFCAFSIFDPQTNRSRRVFRSTKTSDRKQALEICRAWHKAALKARNGKLSADAAREVIAQGVSDVFTVANVESLPSASIKSWCATWLEVKLIEAEETTHVRYKRVIERFTGFLGEAKSTRDISTLQASDVARFRDREAKERARTTANLGGQGVASMSRRSCAARIANGESGCARQSAQRDSRIEAAIVHPRGDQAYPDSVRAQC